MTNYQIKIPHGDLTDLVDEIATRVVSHAVVTAGSVEPRAELLHSQLHPAVFQACKDVLRKYVRGFHVCGCRPHCDREAQGTELGETKPTPRQESQLSRYVLSLEVPLKEFAKELEVELVRAVTQYAPVKNWRKLLFPVVRDVVEPTLGKYIHYSPTCNRGEYICTVGACTEFDPWNHIRPQ